MGDGGKRYTQRRSRITNEFNNSMLSVSRRYDDILPREPRNDRYVNNHVSHPEITYFNNHTRPKLERIGVDLIGMNLLPPRSSFRHIWWKLEHRDEEASIARRKAFNDIFKTGDEEKLITAFIDTIRVSAFDYLCEIKDSIETAVRTIARYYGKEASKTLYSLEDSFITLESYGYKPLAGNQITMDDVHHVQRMPDVIIGALTDFLPEDAAEQLIAWRQEQARLAAQDKPTANP